MNAVKKYISSAKSIFGKIGHNPEIDWHFALFMFVTGTLLAVGIDAALFMKMNDTGADSPDATAASVTLNRKDITEAVDGILKDDVNSSIIPDLVKKDPSKLE